MLGWESNSVLFSLESVHYQQLLHKQATTEKVLRRRFLYSALILLGISNQSTKGSGCEKFLYCYYIKDTDSF